MSQNNTDFSNDMSGVELLDDYLTPLQENINTSNSGVQRPSYAVAGTKWLDTSVTPWLWKMYDGTNDITLGTINPSTHLFTPAGVDSKQDIANLSQTLDDSTTKYPSNNAVKTAVDAVKTAVDASLPSQTGNSGKFLQTNGSNTVWTDAVDYTNITNCITKIPHDIKLELNNGTLTLKAGSKVHVPNGVGMFDEVAIQSDIILSGSFWDSDNDVLLFYKDSTLTVMALNKCSSGNTAPVSPQNFDYWYDTSENLLKRYYNGSWTSGFSFPLGQIHANANQVTSIDQVFNGFGYIGNIFFRNNVSVLLPNYRNSDGSLNNIVVNRTGVRTHLPIIANGNYYFHISQDDKLAITFRKNYIISETEPPFIKSGCWYNPKTNIIWKSVSSSTSWTKFPSFRVADCGTLKMENGRITSLKPNSVFQAVDRKEYKSLHGIDSNIDYVVERKVNSDGSWYRKYKSGWLEQGGIGLTVSQDSTQTVTLIKPFNDTKYIVNWLNQNGFTTQGMGSRGVNNKTTTSFVACNGQDLTMNIGWVAFGKGA